MLEKSIKQLHEMLKNKEITPSDLYNEAKANIDSKNGEINAILTEIDNNNLNDIEINNVLSGVPFTLKDNINVENYKTTASSQILKDYVSNYNAKVTDLLLNTNATLMGKDNMDEFANGISTKSSYFGPSINPLWKDRLVGGSSGGSAASVAAGFAKFSIGTETGGSVRLPAAWNDLVGFKPTYGAISRYGIISFASSLDTVGIMSNSVEDVAYVFDELNKKDDRDFTNIENDVVTATNIDNDISNVKFAMLEGVDQMGIDQEIKDALAKTKEIFNINNEVSIKHADHAADIYYSIACVELFSNLNRFDGIRYGIDSDVKDLSWSEVIKNTRSKFSLEVKKRIIVGGLLVNSDENKELLKRSKVMRQEMFNDLETIFESNDIVVLPTTATLPPLVDEEITPERLALTDKFTIISSLCGNPAISIPAGYSKDGLPVAIQLIAKQFNDDLLLNVANHVYKQLKGEK